MTAETDHLDTLRKRFKMAFKLCKNRVKPLLPKISIYADGAVFFSTVVQSEYHFNDYGFIRFFYDAEKHWLGVALCETRKDGAIPLPPRPQIRIAGILKILGIDINDVVGSYYPHSAQDDAIDFYLDLTERKRFTPRQSKTYSDKL